jgi:general nucleoside transport system permease protein
MSAPSAPAASMIASRGARPRLASAARAAASPLAVILALLVGAVFIAAVGADPIAVYGLMLQQCLGTGYGLGQTLAKSTPLIFTGLAVALGFRAGLFNIGVEGQLYLGGFAAAIAGVALGGLPAPILLPIALLSAAAAGAVWGAIPGVLKARFGAHEVINTIMMNFIAFALVAFFGRTVFQPATVRTAEIGAGAVLPRLDAWFGALRGSPANAALVIGLAAAAIVYVLLFRTRLGYEIRAVGLNPGAAEFGGISIGRTQVLAMALSGALAGLGGTSFVLGHKHWFEQGFSGGAGFLGIAVALIGRNHPLGVVIAALFFGTLSYGGLVIAQSVPRELVDMLQALVILFAIALQQILERFSRRWA